MTMLSPHFSLEELTASPTASRLGIDNTPNAAQRSNLVALCFNILEPVREHYGKPVVSVSGLRVEALNAATPGASKQSQHCLGEADDFHVVGVPVGAVTLWIAVSNMPFDQLILEFASEQNPKAGWTHVSYGPRKRREVLTYSLDAEGKTIKTAGLPLWVHTQFGSGSAK